MGSHDDHFHLWKEVHKDIAHQLLELQKVAHRMSEVEKRMGRLSIQVDGVEVRVAEQEVVGNRFSRLVLWTVGGVLHTLAKVEFLQQLVSSFLSFGGRSDDGSGLPDGANGPPRGPGPRSSPSPCPSLQSLQSSNFDSPLVTTPSSVRGSDLPGPFSEAEEDWLGSALQALPSPTSSHGFDNQLPSIRRGVWGVSSLEDVEGGIGDASHIGVS